MKYLHFLTFALLLWGCKREVPNENKSERMYISFSQVSQSTPCDNTAYNLFDGNTGTAWFTGWPESCYPQRCIVDLGQRYYLSSIRFYDGSGTPRIKITATNGSSDSMVILHKPLDMYEVWQTVEVPITPTSYRYLKIELDGVQDSRALTELEIFRFSKKPVISPTDTLPKNKPTGAGAAINVCGFHWVPMDRLSPFSATRLYISSEWIWRPDGLFVEPIYQAQTADVNGLDTYLIRAKQQGLRVLPCIHQTPKWMVGDADYADGGADQNPARPKNADKTVPSSYAAIAEMYRQFVMRYGSRKHKDGDLHVDKTPRWKGDVPNEKKSGLNLITHIEVWNEPDKWWKIGTDESEAYMPPREYAAMLSACYDAIKAADPSVLVVMGGLTGADMPYLTEMHRWFEQQGMNFKADVINIHHYSNTANDATGWPPSWSEAGAICPEKDKAFEKIANVVAFAKGIGRPVWVTEFGYDTRPPSPMYASPVGGFTSEQLQAQWLARSYLEYMRKGVDNCFLFNIVDERGAPYGGLYQNSGILYGEGSDKTYSPKPAHGVLAQLAAELSGGWLAKDLSKPSYRMLQFNFPDGRQKVVYWSPTMEGKTFPLPNTNLTVTEWPRYQQLQ